MRILLTNDDGIDAIGIRMLAEFASGLGEVTVVAPKVEQSGKSHAIDFACEIEIKRVDFPFGIEAYSMDSTPADCVRFGILGLNRKYDLVLSGINRGVNVGVDLVYSGTVGAIFEAARLNTAAIAFSAFFDGQAEAAEHFGRVFDFLTERGLLSEGRIFNVNIPKAVKGIRMTYQGSQYFSDAFVRKEGDIFIQRGEHIPDLCPNDLNRDTVAIHNDIISVTPLMRTRTDMEIYNRFAEEV